MRHFIVYRYLETPPMLFLPNAISVREVAAWVYHRGEDPRAKAHVRSLLGRSADIPHPAARA